MSQHANKIIPDFLSDVDAAMGCLHCGGSLEGSPSDEFDSPNCQAAWYQAHVASDGGVLTGYREPLDDLPYVGELPSEAEVSSLDGWITDYGDGDADGTGWISGGMAACDCPQCSGAGDWSVVVDESSGGITEFLRIGRAVMSILGPDGEPAVSMTITDTAETQAAEPWSLPRQTADLGADVRALSRATRLAARYGGPEREPRMAAVRLRGLQLADRYDADNGRPPGTFVAQTRSAWEQTSREIGTVYARIFGGAPAPMRTGPDSTFTYTTPGRSERTESVGLFQTRGPSDASVFRMLSENRGQPVMFRPAQEFAGTTWDPACEPQAQVPLETWTVERNEARRTWAVTNPGTGNRVEITDEFMRRTSAGQDGIMDEASRRLRQLDARGRHGREFLPLDACEPEPPPADGLLWTPDTPGTLAPSTQAVVDAHNERYTRPVGNWLGEAVRRGAGDVT